MRPGGGRCAQHLSATRNAAGPQASVWHSFYVSQNQSALVALSCLSPGAGRLAHHAAAAVAFSAYLPLLSLVRNPFLEAMLPSGTDPHSSAAERPTDGLDSSGGLPAMHSTTLWDIPIAKKEKEEWGPKLYMEWRRHQGPTGQCNCPGLAAEPKPAILPWAGCRTEASNSCQQRMCCAPRRECGCERYDLQRIMAENVASRVVGWLGDQPAGRTSRTVSSHAHH